MPLTPALVNDADFGLKISASLITGSGDNAVDARTRQRR